MMSSVVECSRLRFSLFSPGFFGHRVRSFVRYVRSVERAPQPPPAVPSFFSVSFRIFHPPRFPSTKEIFRLCHRARGRAERYNVPRTRSVSASAPVHAAGIYRLCRWSLVWTSSAIPPRERTRHLLLPSLYILLASSSSSASCSSFSSTYHPPPPLLFLSFSASSTCSFSRSPSWLLLSPALRSWRSPLL